VTDGQTGRQTDTRPWHIPREQSSHGKNEMALQRAEMIMVRWMCGVRLKDSVSNKELTETDTRNSGDNFGTTAKQVTTVWTCVAKGG